MKINELYELLKTSENIIKTRISLTASFEMYLRFMFLAINETNITIKPFHLQIIKALEDITFQQNTKRNLCLNLPVGSGKSLLTEYYISWNFARDINCAFTYVSHSDTLINKLSKETKDIVEHPIWIQLFQATLKKDERSKVNWSFDNSKNRTGLMAGTIGGAITGIDAGNPNVDGFSGALLIDDPIDAGKITYELSREECIRFYEDKLSTRRRTPTTPTILIMQRLHIEDLAGYLKTKYSDDWEFIVIQAMNDNGTSFWEERYPVIELNQIRDNSPDKYFSQYQQNPTLKGGNLFKLDWFMFTDDLPLKYDYRFITADIAYKDKEQNDFTVFAYWGVKDKKLYLIDMQRNKIPALDIERWIECWIKEKVNWGFRNIWIEDKAHGIYLNQTFRQKGYPIPSEEEIKETLPRDRDKVQRANNVLPYIDKINHNIFINKNIECLEDFKSEILGFPNAQHDDCVDVFVDGLKIALAEEDIVKFYERAYG